VFDYEGKTALVTGASLGLGAEFARALASHGADLLLVARSEAKLRSLTDELAARHGGRVEVVTVDLSREGAAEGVSEEARRRGLLVDVLVNNAGFATGGRFEDADLENEHQEVMLNTAAVLDLAHAFVPGMLERGRGAIVNVASTAAFQPAPYMATYGATKAFVLSFSETLWAEYHSRGVRVLALAPGATETAFWDSWAEEQPRGTEAFAGTTSAEQVVAAAFKALEGGKSYAVPGLRKYLIAQLPRLMPRSFMARASEWLLRPRKR
jgi:uncharacterized protein